MSRRSERVAAETCVALGADDARVESYPNRELSLGSLAISRALPVRERRLVGPWCFLDRFGPLTFSDGKPMDVAPHPHMGLQTVTWLLQGEVIHDDSLGYESILRPGGVNVMTAGGAIAHAEPERRRHSRRSATRRSGSLLRGEQTFGNEYLQSHRRSPVAHRRATVSGEDSHVVELRRSNGRGDRHSSR